MASFPLSCDSIIVTIQAPSVALVLQVKCSTSRGGSTNNLSLVGLSAELERHTWKEYDQMISDPKAA